MPLRLLQRLQIKALLETTNYHGPHIASIVRCYPKTVFNWKKRFSIEGSILDKPRIGRPLCIPLEATPRLIAFYCQHNPLPGCSRWTIRWAERYLNNHPNIIQVPISRSTIHRCLVSHHLRPYRWKYFLHISDPKFFEKMEKIIQVYLNPPKYLFCFDECTGLQALEKIAPKLHAEGKRPEYREFDYKRHGTVSIFSILEVSNGKIFTDCIPDHTSATIIQSLKKHISLYDPSEPLHYICDNYFSHSTEAFCQEIASLCNITAPNLKAVNDRRLWLESADKRIIFHFLPFHGSWLNQIEIWFGILQQKALKDENFSSTSALINTILDFTDTWNNHFSHPFEWTYDGEDLYGKVVRRLAKWIQLETPQLSFKFFEKQLKLMSNLVNNHWMKANKCDWLALHKTIEEKNKFCWDIIESINNTHFKNIKGDKNDSDADIEAKITLKIKQYKENLTYLLSDFENRLTKKLELF